MAREDLALAFALDTIGAAARCPQVRALVVVTDDPRVTHALRAAAQHPPDIEWTGADPVPIDIVPDLPAGGLNAALRHGAAVSLREYGPIGLGALSADLPALRPSELGVVLRAAHGHDVAMVADSSGEGTTLLLARSPAMFKPSFGTGSRARHEADGAAVVGDDMASVRRDVDTLSDLHAALALGVGAATRAETERLLDVDGAA